MQSPNPTPPTPQPKRKPANVLQKTVANAAERTATCRAIFEQAWQRKQAQA